MLLVMARERFEPMQGFLLRLLQSQVKYWLVPSDSDRMIGLAWRVVLAGGPSRSPRRVWVALTALSLTHSQMLEMIARARDIE